MKHEFKDDEKRNQRAVEAALELNANQLAFARFVMERFKTNSSLTDCYERAFPDCNHDTARANATKLARHPKVVAYRVAMGEDSQAALGQSLETSLDRWLENSKSAYERLSPYCEVMTVVSDDGSEAADQLWVQNPDAVPRELKRFVEKYRVWEGGYLVVPKDDFDHKDRVKCLENFDKVAGNQRERIELTGVVGTVSTVLPEGSTIEDIAQLYQKAVTGR